MDKYDRDVWHDAETVSWPFIVFIIFLLLVGLLI